jgi:hypothetical protein
MAENDTTGTGASGDVSQPSAADAAAAAQATELQARSMGWRPRSEFRGNPDGWLDADEYVKRGETLLPLLKSQTRQQEAELARVREQAAQQAKDLEAAKAAIEELNAFHAEVRERIQTSDEAVLARQLAEAREKGDTLAEIQVLRELNKVAAAPKEEPKPPAAAPTDPPAKPPQWQDTPDGKSFLTANPWFNEDRRMRAMFVEIGQELAEQGRLTNLTVPQRLELVRTETLKFFGRQPAGGGPSRVESGAPSQGASGGEGEHNFTDLPPEARDACERQAQYLVGPKKAYKDIASWRKAYADRYFRDWGNELSVARGSNR